MNKILLLITFFCFSFNFSHAQEKYFTKTGQIYFMSHTDAIDIDGTNKQVVSFLDATNGELVFAVLIKSFEFTLATASEHFNETYMESHKFPKANFKGKIKNFEKLDLKKTGTYQIEAEGQLTIHGITKNVIEKATLVIEKEQIIAHAEMKVNIADYEIKVPKIVEERVAKTVDVKIDIKYLPFKK